MEGVFIKNVSGFLTVYAPDKSWEQRRSRATVMAKNNKFCMRSALFFKTCANTTLFGGRKHRNQMNSISSLSSNLRAAPRLRRDFIYICHFMRVEINAKKQKKKPII